jgi:Domain of unknown function (DUF4352)
MMMHRTFSPLLVEFFLPLLIVIGRSLVNSSNVSRPRMGKDLLVVLLIVYLLIMAGGFLVALGYSGSASFLFPAKTPRASGPLNISVTRIITDTVELGQPQGYTYWILQLFINNTDRVSHYIDPYYFQLFSNTNAVYSPTVVAAIHNLLPSLNLSSGQTTNGQIAFKLPNGTSPEKLVYSYANSTNEKIDITVSNLPQTYANTSFIEGGPVNVIGNDSNYISAYLTVSYFHSGNAYSYSGYFYSGNISVVKIALNNYLQGTNVTVSGISASNAGFTILGISQSIPVSVGKYELDLFLYFEPPPTPFVGQLNITVTTT